MGLSEPWYVQGLFGPKVINFTLRNLQRLV